MHASLLYISIVSTVFIVCKHIFAKHIMMCINTLNISGPPFVSLRLLSDSCSTTNNSKAKAICVQCVDKTLT
jgi:hypothetical protein